MFIALIALALLTISGVALMRTLAPAATIAGNIAFKQSATQASDVGVELAFVNLQDKVNRAVTHVDASPHYYALMGATDANGLPQLGTPVAPIDWNDSRLPCFSTAGAPSNCSDESQYRIQYVIDRQCTAIAGVSPQTDTEVAENCLVLNTNDSRESRRSDRMLFPPPKPVVYRATIHVRGPRNTSSLVQTSLTF